MLLHMAGSRTVQCRNRGQTWHEIWDFDQIRRESAVCWFLRLSLLYLFVVLIRDSDNYVSHAVGELRRVIIVSIWQIERKSIGSTLETTFLYTPRCCVKKYMGYTVYSRCAWESNKRKLLSFSLISQHMSCRVHLTQSEFSVDELLLSSCSEEDVSAALVRD